MTDFCRFSILTEIVLNHMTETAEILPKGLTVERNDFDRCRYIKIFLNTMKLVFKKSLVSREFVISWVRYIEVRL